MGLTVEGRCVGNLLGKTVGIEVGAWATRKRGEVNKWINGVM